MVESAKESQCVRRRGQGEHRRCGPSKSSDKRLRQETANPAEAVSRTALPAEHAHRFSGEGTREEEREKKQRYSFQLAPQR